jgi:SagB-type dehydrogenase family enzyme
MRTCWILAASIIFPVCFTCPTAFSGQTSQTLTLPKPQMTGGRPLMDVLADRRSSREFSARPLPLQVLSNLLWAGFGVNRRDSGGRTAPSARNWQEVDIYVATKEGLYLYDARAKALERVLARDIRPLTGLQDFVRTAPVNLVYVADFSKMQSAPENDRLIYSAIDAGFISQNVYLYCASAGLVTVVRGSVDRAPLAKAMNLRPDQRIIVAQTVGFPAK